MSSLVNIIKQFFKGHERSVKLKKHIISSFAIKGLSIIIGFLMVPLSLEYIDKTRYGVWLTLSSFLTWFAFFEIGLGSGLRNKLAESLAKNDLKSAKMYVSTTYAILTIVTLSVALIFFAVNPFLNWSKILNTSEQISGELSILSLIVFGFFFLRFVLQLINTVLYADQKPAIVNLMGPLGNLISLLVIFILTKTTNGSLLYLGITLSISPILVLFTSSVLLYRKKYKNIAPSIKHIDFNHAKDLFNIGVKFFLIRISGLVLYQTSNIIIAHAFGNSEVTVYNIAYKYFSIVYMLFSILVSPFWSAYTEAWVKKDIAWIRNSVGKLIKIWFGVAAFSALMLIFAKPFYLLWVGSDIIVPFQVSFFATIYFLIFALGGVFVMFINGVGKIKLQLILSVIVSIIYLPLNYLLIKVLNLGIASIFISLTIVSLISLVFMSTQYRLIMNGKAEGIWNQ